MDPLSRGFPDAPVHGVIEMLGPDDRGGLIKQVVIGQDRTQKLLFGLNIGGQFFWCRGGHSRRVHLRYFIHCGPRLS